MAPEIVDVFRRGARTTVYALAMGVALLPISAFVVQDLWRSVREVQALTSGADCGQAPPPCTTAIAVTLDGPYEARRDALVTWWTVDDGGAVGDVRLLPSAAVRADLRPGPATAYVVDGKVVAVAAGDRRVPTALAGTHAVFVDSAGLLMTLPFAAMLLRIVRAARRSGVRWTDPVAPRRRVRPKPRTPPEMVVAAIGSVALLLTIRLGLAVGATAVTHGSDRGHGLHGPASVAPVAARHDEGAPRGLLSLGCETPPNDQRVVRRRFDWSDARQGVGSDVVVETDDGL